MSEKRRRRRKGGDQNLKMLLPSLIRQNEIFRNDICLTDILEDRIWSIISRQESWGHAITSFNGATQPTDRPAGFLTHFYFLLSKATR